MFQRFFRNKPLPLAGAPAVRRLKTYSAQSGYVYQYYYQGHRPFGPSPETGTEFVFEVSADRKTSQSVSVFISEEAVGSWEGQHQRSLSPTERYAIAKMALFQAFDERANPDLMKHHIRVRPADIDGILNTLDIE